MIHPEVLEAANPIVGMHYLLTHGEVGFAVLGGVFLAVTGAEALYADMGHMGAKPIRMAWYGLVLPSLILNYAGQTGIFISESATDDNIFFQLCPPSLHLPLVALATVATIIASQSIITGAYSMTRQAINLGWCPRLPIIQTSIQDHGQIYIGAVNWALMAVTVSLTVVFGSSDRLAAAYGIAVSLTMLLTTILLFIAMREIWKWKIINCLAIAGSFFVIDFTFFCSNLLKLFDGGWVPLVLACAIYTLMVVWRKGSIAMAKAMQCLTIPVSEFQTKLDNSSIPRVPGTAIFLSKSSAKVPPVIIWHVTHSKALHKHVIALSIVMTHKPWIEKKERLTVERLGLNFWRIVAHYGFMEKPNIPELLREAKLIESELHIDDVVYYIGHETIRHSPDGLGLPLWQEKTYALLHRNAAQVHDYLNLPQDSVVEIGRLIEI
jgi:KUP system potassium uptake protein